MVPRHLFPYSCAILAAFLAVTANAQDAKSNAKEDQVVIRVEGQEVKESDILREIDNMVQQIASRLPANMRGQFDNDKYGRFFPQAVNKLTKYTLLRNEAKKLKLTVTPEDITAEIDQIKKQLPDEETFKKALEQQGLTEEKLKEKMKEDLLIKKVLDTSVKEPAAPTDEEIKAFYDENQDKFVKPEQITASHILLAVSEETTPEQKADLKKKITGIKADIEGGKIAFADAAMKYSSCPSKERGGDLGSFGKGQMVEAFETAAFAAPLGKLTDVVETQFGYHIIQVNKHEPSSKVALEEAKEQITGHLKQQADQKELVQYLDDLEKKAKVEKVMTPEQWQERHGVKQPAAPTSPQSIQIDPNNLPK